VLSLFNEYVYLDKNIESGKTYYYRLSDVSYSGQHTYHSTIEVYTATISQYLALHPNYPNQFNSSTKIRFEIPRKLENPEHVTLEVYNSLGQLVTVLYEGRPSGGQYEIKWDASDQPSGLYLLKLQSDQFVEMHKMILLR